MQEHRSRFAWNAAFAAGIGLTLIVAPQVSAADSLQRVRFSRNASEQEVEGQILLEAVDGGLLIEDRSGRYWNITPAELRDRADLETPFAPFTADELGASLRAEFGDAFEIVQTPHYVICTNAGSDFGQWCGELFERLLTSFLKQWNGGPLALHEPDRPLTVVIFSSPNQFREYAAKEGGAALSDAQGYYSMRTNRVALCDLTSGRLRGVRSHENINRAVTAAAQHVATVVHEATHQIAFNCGMHSRFADNPVWLTEGLAMYYETPDLSSRTGWRTAGQINRSRLKQFMDYVRRGRPKDSLIQLLSSDERFRDPKTAPDAYAEAWALAFFLVRTRQNDVAQYVARVGAKPRLIWDNPDQRLADIKAVWGNDLDRLNREFEQYIRRLR